MKDIPTTFVMTITIFIFNCRDCSWNSCAAFTNKGFFDYVLFFLPIIILSLTLCLDETVYDWLHFIFPFHNVFFILFISSSKSVLPNFCALNEYLHTLIFYVKIRVIWKFQLLDTWKILEQMPTFCPESIVQWESLFQMVKMLF